jgi:hypothetical protein
LLVARVARLLRQARYAIDQERSLRAYVWFAKGQIQMLRAISILCVLMCGACGDNIRFGGDGGTGSGDDSGTGDDGGITVAPVVLSTVPADTATSVAQTTFISATFSNSMDATTLSAAFLVKQGSTVIDGSVALESVDSAVFTPAAALDPSLVYTATITTGATDTGGLALAADYTWMFTTAANANPPEVTATSPVNLALNARVSTKPTATFSKAMNPSTINAQTFRLRQGLTPIAGVVTLDGARNTAKFSPSVPLSTSMLYTATITTGAKDTGGGALAADFTWTFTTGACSQGTVDLRTAGRFGVLASSTVTSTGPTSVTGDLGVSPGTAITGFPPGILVGTKHAGNPTAARAAADLVTAYNDAAGRVGCAVTVAGNLGGMTLAPGLYKSTSSLAISSGDLTLDAQGDGDAIFIFQMASTLTTTAGRRVTLANGARAANIFWQVGTSATFGTNSVFAGTVMAQAAITMGTGATLDGRALARTAAVALDRNTIVKPAP